MQACVCNGFSFSFICCNWKIIQATSGRIDKELMKGEGGVIKGNKEGEVMMRMASWRDTEETSAAAAAAACVCV